VVVDLKGVTCAAGKGKIGAGRWRGQHCIHTGRHTTNVCQKIKVTGKITAGLGRGVQVNERVLGGRKKNKIHIKSEGHKDKE